VSLAPARARRKGRLTFVLTDFGLSEGNLHAHLNLLIWRGVFQFRRYYTLPGMAYLRLPPAPRAIEVSLPTGPAPPVLDQNDSAANFSAGSGL